MKTLTLPLPVPAFQPGPLNAATGWRPHRIEVLFTVETAQDSLLRLEFAAGHGPCPDLEIELDGKHRGLWHPRVRREDRSEVYRHGPIAGDVALDVPLPAAWLAPGDHVLAITTTLDESAWGPVEPGRHRPQFGNHFGSGITWHALTLVPGQHHREINAELQATPLYPHGGTVLLDLTVTVPPLSGWPSKALVRLGNDSFDLDLGRDRDFGQVKILFPVPELDTETGAEVVIGDYSKVTRLRPARKWTLHLIPHVHLDVGYTDVQGKVLELHSRNLDRALDALDRDGDFAFSVDGSLIIEQYLATRSPDSARRLKDALRSKRLSVNAFHSLFLSGVASLEEIYRAAYLSARLRDEHGVPITYANLTDVPSYSAALPPILKALGIDAFIGIENHHRGGNADSDGQHLESPVMWEGIDGTRVLTHFSDTYSQLRFMAGDPQTIAGGTQAFCRLLKRYERDDYLPHDLAVIGTHADNEDLADGDAGFADRWNTRFRYPQIKKSTMGEYLEAVRPLADRLPVWRGDGGSYWEDGVGTGAAVTAEHRRVQALLPAAQGLAALVARIDPRYSPNREALEKAWEGALYGCEHTWTWAHANAHPHGHQTGDQLDWKRHQVRTAHRIALDETRRALSQLGELVTTDGPTLVVHNPLPWARDADIEFESVAAHGEVLADCDGLQRLRLTVKDVPGFGYRTMPLRQARTLAPGEEDGSGFAGAASETGWRPVPGTLQTRRWQVTLDPASGAVTGLVHRATGRQLLDGALGRVLYALNGPVELTRGEHHEHSGVPHRHAPIPRTTLQGRRPKADPPELTVTAATMRPVGLRRTYDGWRVRTVGEAPSMPRIEVDVLLRDGSDRVDVTVSLDKQRVLAKESVYLAFPFAAEQPVIHYDRQQGWIDPATDHAPGACQDWFTTQHGVVVESRPGGPAVAWTSAHAPLFTIDDIVRGQWRERFHARTGTLMSWVLNNYWPTNTPPEQDGTLHLRYAFTPLDSFDPVAASRFGLEVRCEAVAGEVTWLDKFDTGPRPLSAESASLLDLGLPDWVHATVAPARDGRGLLLRLRNLSSNAGRLELKIPAIPCRADESDASEPPRRNVDLDPWQVVSMILR